MRDLGIAYPVALDNNYAIWQGFNNQYWPAHYFIDAQGHIRGHHFGEGNYAESEQIIRDVLTEAGYSRSAAGRGCAPRGSPVRRLAQDSSRDESPETYHRRRRAPQNFASPGGWCRIACRTTAALAALDLNQWALRGPWTVDAEQAAARCAAGRIVFRFHARDLHLVLGPGRRQAGPLPRAARRRRPRREPGDGRRCERPRRGRSRAAVSIDPAIRSRCRHMYSHRISGRQCRRLFVYFRVNTTMSKRPTSQNRHPLAPRQSSRRTLLAACLGLIPAGLVR